MPESRRVKPKKPLSARRKKARKEHIKNVNKLERDIGILKGRVKNIARRLKKSPVASAKRGAKRVKKAVKRELLRAEVRRNLMDPKVKSGQKKSSIARKRAKAKAKAKKK
jgi:hypothetical protein